MPFLLGSFGKISQSLNLSQFIPLDASKQINSTFFQGLNNQLKVIAGYFEEELQYDRILPLPNKQGLLLGRIFEGKSDKEVHLSSKVTETIVEDLQKLSTLFWGRYIGVLVDEKKGEIVLVRDPMGHGNIYYYKTQDGILFSTDLFYIFNLIPKKLNLNWNYFLDHIVNQNHALASTPFCEIKELLPGMALRIDPEGRLSETLIWDVSTLKGEEILNKNAFEEELLFMLKNCVTAWSNNASGICLELSGGTDSSSIALLLHSIYGKNKKIICVNYVDSTVSSSNEIQYGREVADFCQFPLHLVDTKNECFFLPSLPSNWRPDRPGRIFLNYDRGQQLKTFANSVGCDHVLSGQGGDHVFLAPPFQNSLLDAFLDRKFKNLKSILFDLCAFYRTSLIDLIKKNLQELVYYSLGKKFEKFVNTSYIHQSRAKSFIKEEFYLSSYLQQHPPAKSKQIQTLSHAIADGEVGQRDRSVYQCHPLLSQPLVELALKIPTYQSFEEGYNRIFLRKAVSRIKILEAIWRRGKSFTTGSALNAFKASKDGIYDLLLQGQLIKNHVVDREWIEKELIKATHGQILNLWTLTHMITCELWFKQWNFN